MPIVPSLLPDVHRMWQAYNGFTFAFAPYLDSGLAPFFDGEKLAQAWEIIDPIHFLDRLEKVPKFITVSSDDEFMMMDQTEFYFDKLKGEKHLLIAPNTEHIMVTGVPDILSTMTTNIRSVMLGKTKRSTFSYNYNNETGALSVTVPLDQD